MSERYRDNLWGRSMSEASLLDQIKAVWPGIPEWDEHIPDGMYSASLGAVEIVVERLHPKNDNYPGFSVHVRWNTESDDEWLAGDSAGVIAEGPVLAQVRNKARRDFARIRNQFDFAISGGM